MGGSPLSGLVGGLTKARQVLDLTRNNNAEDLLHQRRVLTWRAKIGSKYFLFLCVARALNRRAAFSFHVDTCIFPRDKTGLTMGKPEVVNLTLIYPVSYTCLS
jgi:hypothetical protein